jgi:plastocyanin
VSAAADIRGYTDHVIGKGSLLRRKNIVLVSALIAAVAVTLFAAVAGRATTGVPGTFATINVKIYDSKLVLSKHSSSGVQVIGFRIHNLGKKKHNFVVGMQSTRPIAPGQYDDFAVQFDVFGKYHYKCTLNCLKSMRGVIDVKRGNFNGNGG